ncbi:MAG: hypothetical protein ACR2F8_11570 [Caulobacteraceae bacterium]
MTIMGTDIYRRVHSPLPRPLPPVLYDEGEGLATQVEAEIYGPEVLVAYYRAGYA